MHEEICQTLLANGVEILYVTNRAVENSVKRQATGVPSFHCERVINEAAAVESALAASLAGKRTACLSSTEALYEAVYPLTRCASAIVDRGFLIIAVEENDQEVTPLGLYSKLPLLVTEDVHEFEGAVEYGYALSERYKIPVMIETAALTGGRGEQRATDRFAGADRRPGRKNQEPEAKPARTIYNFSQARCERSNELDRKIEKIRTEFENYEGNRMIVRNETGLITSRLTSLAFYDEDISLLKISTIFPLPLGLVADFINKKEMVFIAETYPVMEAQIHERTKLSRGPAGMLHRGPKPEETTYGFHVVRDKLGPASSINMARGIKRSMPETKVLAVTYEDFFFDCGIPAFVDTLIAGTPSVILIMSNNKEDAIKEIFRGFGFHNYFHLNDFSEVQRFRDVEELTVLFCKGI
ncbi:MAG TPA: hypothetical protein VMT62_01275 [Syntrophorhabdaceae bacterium]|nr:hypothetical protein [Syntrophorhabdaceae bacterium]